MAQKVVTQIIDDFTKTEIEEGQDVVRVIVDRGDGYARQFDTTQQTLEEHPSEYISMALSDPESGAPVRKVGSTRKSAAPAQPNHNAEIRTWARDKGYAVGLRGKIPDVIKQEYAIENAA